MEGSSSRRSSLGKYPEFLEVANKLGRVLAERKMNLVYGGGSLGLIGHMSTAAHIGGSQVLGIIPSIFTKGNTCKKIVGQELKVWAIPDCIANMLYFFNAFIALSSGPGTLEEIFQIASWSQLCIHHKPIGLMNVNYFYDGLLSFLNNDVE